MPKPKRNRGEIQGKPGKKPTKKQLLIDEIQKSAEKFSCIFTFTAQNMRHGKLKELRQEWRPSRFYFGKYKAMSFALGRNPQRERRRNLHRLAKQLKGQCGLLFTDTPKDEVIEWFKNYHGYSNVRSGDVATETIMLKKGPCPKIPPSQVDTLKNLGMPINSDGGSITLLDDYSVCEKGDVLSHLQSQIMNILQINMAEFRIHLGSVWTSDGRFQVLNRARVSWIQPQPQAGGSAPQDDEMDDDSPGSDDDDNYVEYDY